MRAAGEAPQPSSRHPVTNIFVFDKAVAVGFVFVRAENKVEEHFESNSIDSGLQVKQIFFIRRIRIQLQKHLNDQFVK